jgi:hypothetical protein
MQQGEWARNANPVWLADDCNCLEWLSHAKIKTYRPRAESLRLRVEMNSGFCKRARLG